MFQVLWRLQMPHALPNLFTGIRISSGISVIGAITGELFASSNRVGEGGLGYSIIYANAQLQTDFLFALVLASSALGFTFFFTVVFFEWLFLHHWHESPWRWTAIDGANSPPAMDSENSPWPGEASVAAYVTNRRLARVAARGGARSGSGGECDATSRDCRAVDGLSAGRDRGSRAGVRAMTGIGLCLLRCDRPGGGYPRAPLQRARSNWRQRLPSSPSATRR